VAITTSVIDMEQHHVGHVGAALGRAFFDDPMIVYVLPDESRRAGPVQWFMTIAARYGHRYGRPHTTTGEPLGAAIWLPPGETSVPAMRMMRAGMWAAPFRLGIDPFGRFMTVMDRFEKLHERDMHEPHWYLMVLGVDPPHQGRGVGSTLISPMLERADSEHLPCYLETAKEKNVAFYQRHGFEVVVEDAIPDGFRYWTMKRPAR
jgi:ribosomal protein S18 acetylase RimI-like enzyme